MGSNLKGKSNECQFFSNFTHNLSLTSMVKEMTCAGNVNGPNTLMGLLDETNNNTVGLTLGQPHMPSLGQTNNNCVGFSLVQGLGHT